MPRHPLWTTRQVLIAFDLVPELATNVWVVVLGVLSLLFFLSYIASGFRNWGRHSRDFPPALAPAKTI